jgi:FlaA1/EpsC-like NDP-sugar epimerase
MLYIAIFADFLMTFVFALNLYRINKGKKQICDYKYRIYNRFTIYSIITIVLLLISIYEIIVSYFNTGRVIPLFNAYVCLLMIILICIYLSNKNYICDSGIWFSGRLYKWSDITTYSWIEDSRYILFQINDNSIISEYKLRFRIEKEQKEEIESYLSSNMGK